MQHTKIRAEDATPVTQILERVKPVKPTTDEFNNRAREKHVDYFDHQGQRQKLRIPKGMHIQAIDIIDPDRTLVRHQIPLAGQIERASRLDHIACIIVLAPDIKPKEPLWWLDYADHKDPCQYLVTNLAQAKKLTLEGDAFKYMIDRRVNELRSKRRVPLI